METGEDGCGGGARVLTAALEAGRILTIYLKPILPEFAAKVEKCLGVPALKWEHVQDAMEPHSIQPFEHLIQRLDMKAVEAMVEESKESLGENSKLKTQNAKPADGSGGGGERLLRLRLLRRQSPRVGIRRRRRLRRRLTLMRLRRWICVLREW